MSDRVLASVWLTASAVVALWLVATQRRLRRRLRGCPSCTVDGERVLVSSDFGPAITGVVRPQIVLPEWALAIGDRERRIIVAHETEHRQARDPLLAAVALMIVAALPWNAVLWWQLRRLRLAIEIDCDRRVVTRHGHDPHAYGMLLLATRERASHVAPAMAMAAMRSGLGRRVEALLGGRPQPAVRRLGAVATAGVLAAGIVSVPAPRLSMVRALVADTPVADTPVADTPVVVAPSGSVLAPEIRIIGSSIRVIRPRTDGTAERRVLSGNSASTLEQRWDTTTVGGRRILRSRTAPSRAMLLPGSHTPSPR